MPRKLKYNEAEQKYIGAGFRLIDVEYKNTTYRHSVTCIKCGAVNTLSINDIGYGKKRACEHCTNSYRKHTTSTVRQMFNKSIFTPVDDVPESSRKLIKVRCPKGHILMIDARGASKANQCNECRKMTIEKILSMSSKLEYELMNKPDKVNANILVHLKCLRCGTEHHKKPSVLGTYIKKGTRGCSTCSNKKPITKEELSLVLNERGLSLVSDFKGLGKPAKLLHEDCGKVFSVKTCLNHYHNRAGCPHCSNRIMKSLDELNDILSENNWFISSVPKSTLDNVTLTCIDCGATKYGELRRHLYNPILCPSCGHRELTGFKGHIPALLYYVKIYRTSTGENYYKIGVTNCVSDVNKRFTKKPKDVKITILSTERFEKGSDALVEEAKILDQYSEFRYKGDYFLGRMKGDTELFTTDILGLDQ